MGRGRQGVEYCTRADKLGGMIGQKETGSWKYFERGRQAEEHLDRGTVDRR